MEETETVKFGIKEIKQLPKEEFMQLKGATEQLYEQIHNAKAGWISVVRQRDGLHKKGYTELFGEGISCVIINQNEWWRTSNIQSIDWNNHTFTTLNSVYTFEFKSFEEINKDREKFHEHLNDESKSNQQE